MRFRVQVESGGCSGRVDGQRLAASFFCVRNISLIRCTARSRITSGSPLWWYGYKLPHTHIHTHACALHMQTTLYFCLCLQFLQPAACLLLVCIASHSKLPPSQFVLAFATAVSGVMRLRCSWVRYLYTGQGRRSVASATYIYIYRPICRIYICVCVYIYIYINKGKEVS
jgi:hypothetical protein